MNSPLPGCPSMTRLRVRLTRVLSGTPSIYPTPLEAVAKAAAQAAIDAAALVGTDDFDKERTEELAVIAAEAALAAEAAKPTSDAPFTFSVPQSTLRRTGPTREAVAAAARLGISWALYSRACPPCRPSQPASLPS